MHNNHSCNLVEDKKNVTEDEMTWSKVVRKNKTMMPKHNDHALENKIDSGEHREHNALNNICDIDTVELNKRIKNQFVIIPHKIQSCNVTRAYLRAKLDPVKYNLSDFRNGTGGQIMVQCPLNTNKEKLRKDIEADLGAEYSTSNPLIRMKVMGMTENYSDEEIINFLKKQNSIIPWLQIKIAGRYENKNLKYEKFNVFIDVDEKSFTMLNTLKTIRIGFADCRLVRSIRILRCFKCSQYGHTKTFCKNEETCSKCGENHLTATCKSLCFRCINCENENLKNNAMLDTNHAANSKWCPIYKKELEKNVQTCTIAIKE
ncbi:uncharacterized protein LOC133395109 [Anopheles gambiae]|uniref:uncharacterized protein LOC133395109 n=1 Tax=Anopheles gambiae TaxID=7165 RepID=UPI002AC8E287|nr:uncharacterized protein LOC133395109 [Anopheles gambiae]